MTSRTQILTSLLGLIKNNDGKFKSAKQAAFLLSQCEGGLFYITVSHVFGEHGGCTRRVDYAITCNNEGITHATKNSDQFFPATGKMIKKAEKQAARDEARITRFEEGQQRVAKMEEITKTYTKWAENYASIANSYLVKSLIDEGATKEIAIKIANLVTCGKSVHSLQKCSDAKVARVASKLVARSARVYENARIKVYGQANS